MMAKRNDVWPTRVVKYGAVTATLRRGTTIDNQNRTRIISRLGTPIDSVEGIAHFQFARVCSQIVALEGVDWQPPDALDTPDAIVDAYAEYQKLDGGLTEKWENAVSQFMVASAFNDPDLVPAYLLTEAQKTDPKSSKSEVPTESE